MIDPDAPIPYTLTPRAIAELASWRDELQELQCPQHEWEYSIGRGMTCQNCSVVAESRQSIPSYLSRFERKRR